MKRLSSIKYITLTILFAGTILASAAQVQPTAPQGQVIDKIVAKVNDEIILKSEVDIATQQLRMSDDFMFGDVECAVLTQLIQGKLFVAKAGIDSVEVDPNILEDNLDRRMQALLAQNKMTEADVLEAYGKTLEDLKDEYRDVVKEQLLTQQMQQKIMGNVSVTPSEVQRFFKSIPRDSLPYFSTEIEAGHIVRVARPTHAQKRFARRKLEKIRERILEGKVTFEEMAKSFSEDPGSAAKGGDLGWFSRGQLVKEYEATVLNLKPGEYSEVIESQFGFHFIQLIERRGNKFHSRHILIKVDAGYSGLTEAEDFLDSIRTIIQEDKIKFDMAANKFSDDENTKNNGGYFIDQQSGSYRIPMENVDPTLFFVLDTMQVGTLSKPMPYQTDDGKKAMRILYYKSKVDPHYANLKDDYQKIQQATLMSKKQEAIQKWTKENMSEVFIHVDDTYNRCPILEPKN